MNGHYLRENATSRVPANHIVIDTEAAIEEIDHGRSQRQTLRLGCAIGWRREHGRVTRRSVCTYTQPHGLWEWVRERLSRTRVTWLWAHNAAYDLTLTRFWDHWDSGAFAPRWYALEDPPTIICGALWGRSVMIVDSLNWLPHSLERIGELVGMRKCRMPFAHDDDAEWSIYCMRDCEILERAVQSICDLVEEHDLGVMRPTAAGQAMQCYRHRFLFPGLCVPADRDGETTVRDHKTWERQAYYGGRTELFYRGSVGPGQQTLAGVESDTPVSPVTTLDVTGLYCSVLRDALLPSRVLGAQVRPLVRDLLHATETSGCIAEVLLDTGDDVYPLRTPELVYHPRGRYVTTLCGPELVHALTHGHVVSVVRATTYQLDPIARDYACYWWDMRARWKRERVPILECLAKTMANAWSGKWGQRSSSWSSDTDERCITDRYGEELRWYRWPGRHVGPDSRRSVVGAEGTRVQAQTHHYRAVAGQVEVETDRLPTERSWPAIAAWVTAEGRARMDMFRAAAGCHGILYQCVDCLHCTPDGLRNVNALGYERDCELGYLRRTGMYHRTHYYGINLMRVDGEWHAAGLGRLRTELADGSCDVTLFERLGSILARSPDGSVHVMTRHWQPDYHYRHSVVGDDGWCEPHRLP
jgi:hypothetical protein